MSENPRQELAGLLSDVRGGGSFSTRRTAPTGDLLIKVRDVGPLRMPVTARQAKELRLVARPAYYGKGEETLLDRQVRDTWTVPLSRVSIDKRRWNSTLGPMLDLVRGDLGLAPTSLLATELHSVLVYEPGQFFAAHQDSEKADRMIGSLVVVLPSKCVGGDLVVSHRGETATYRGSPTALTFIAFYGDTRHEVLPVESGYRVALTYNLLLRGHSAAADAVTPARSPLATALLTRYFATPVARDWRSSQGAGEPPDRLVYLLDHQYSEHSLRWPQLKGADDARAAVLRDAAEQADCEVALALVEIQETWDCNEIPQRGRRGWSDWDEDEDDHEPEADEPEADDVHELGELLDSTIEIRSVDGRPVGGRSVADAELASSTPTVKLTPYDTEYTGNMGNYGNTIDRWYRRAAVVVWPRSRAFALLAKGNPALALDQLLTLRSPAEIQQRAAMVVVFLRVWPENVRSHDQQTLFARALSLATQLDDADLAARLMEPFAVEAFASNDADSLLVAANRYGITWFEHQLISWMNPRRHAGASGLATREEWVKALPTFCGQLLNGLDEISNAVKIATAKSFVDEAWAWLHPAIVTANRLARPSTRYASLSSLGASLHAVLQTAAQAGAADLQSDILDAVCTPSVDLSPLLLATIEAADGAARLATSNSTNVDLRSIGKHCAAMLRHELSRPERDRDDWSVEFHRSDCCPDCSLLAEFLTSPARKQLVWPLAKPRRQHIHQQIEEAELPVTHQTRRDGSPHKLVLTKTAETFTRERDRRAAVSVALDNLERFHNQIRRAP